MFDSRSPRGQSIVETSERVDADRPESEYTSRPVVEAKIAAPPLPSGLIDRPRIHAALDAGDACRLTLVVGPAGFGKTTAVRAWCARGEGAALAWVKLDGADNDPIRLWTHVATAVDRIRAGLGRPALRRLRTCNGSLAVPVEELTNSLRAFRDQVTLVLDDLQCVTAAECLSSISSAVEWLPANARLVVLSRSDPALRLPQLRAHGELTELRARDLAFTDEESYELLVEREGIDLSADAVAMLRERTEGWPAAIFLAGRWLRGVADPREAVHAFGGDHRLIVDYLTTEVIDSLDEDSRAFLLRASILGEFTPELCDAALGRHDSEAVLGRLEYSNPFVGHLDNGDRFRVHALFAQFAAHSLNVHDPGAAAAIHARASAWFRSRGLHGQAVEHAIAAGDQDVVADILVEHGLAPIRAGQARQLLGWVRTLDDEHLMRRPELAVGGASAAMMIGSASLERRRLLELEKRAEAAGGHDVSAHVRVSAEIVRAASPDRDVGRAVESGRRAVELARSDETTASAQVASLGAYARALYLAGRIDEAWDMAMQAIEHTDAHRRHPEKAFARTTLALVALDRGWEASARTHAERAKALVDGLGANRTWLGANAAVALGCVHASDGRLAEAERELSSAEHFFRDDVFTVHHAWLLLLIAKVSCRRGRIAYADGTLRAAGEAIQAFVDGGRVPMLAAEVERDIAHARRLVDRGDSFEMPSEAEQAVLRLLPSDYTSRQIAAQLFISPNTVSSHTRAIYRKLGVRSRAEAIVRAEVLGLLVQARSSM